MLSFDISDRQINIVKGDNSSNKIRIERSLQVDVPEDMILNGEVINLSGLSELLLTQIKAEDMMDKDAIVTFSSSNIVFKELVVPKAKGNEFLLMVQNHMSQEMGITDEYSISYTVVGEAGEDNPGAVKVLATACPSTIVESYRKLYNIMGMNLRSVNIGCNSIARIVLADKSIVNFSSSCAVFKNSIADVLLFLAKTLIFFPYYQAGQARQMIMILMIISLKLLTRTSSEWSSSIRQEAVQDLKMLSSMALSRTTSNSLTLLTVLI